MMNKINEKSCELCKDTATNICYDCSFYLCNSCFDFLHDKDENIFHKKETINQIIPIDLKCQKHPKIPMTLFSVVEKSKIYHLII